MASGLDQGKPLAPDTGYVIEASAPPTSRGRTLWRYRGLLGSFALRELQVRYRQSVLGALWALVQPAALIAITTLVFHSALHVDVGSTPYVLFVATGLVPWTFFHTAVSGAVPTLVNQAGLIRKIWFPREALPLATVLAVGVDLLLGLALWGALLAYYGSGWHVTLLWVPALLAILVAFAAACALAGAAVNVRFRDVKHGLPLALQVLFFATPIVYPLTALPDLAQRVAALNPLTAVVAGLREAAIHGVTPDPVRTSLGALGALVFLVVSWLLFLRAERRFADIV
ncbi:MAG: ABC transporter permease [Planctomycetota bacterium]|nr:ABC transporter permease [Planctomycetota bacterium]